jgi:aminomethyltransferase
MKMTALHGQHIELGARMGEFGGWNMPIQYAGILQEHQQTRIRASVFDICHMGEFELSGPTALPDLERLLTCRVQSMKTGQVRYGYLLNEQGGTLDDLTCYRLDTDRFMLVVNAATLDKDAQWIRDHISKETLFTDLSGQTAKLDVQGPQSRDVLEDVFGCSLPELGYFRFTEFETSDVSVLLSRTGYTGEWGYEIYLPNAAAAELWKRLVSHGRCEPGGLGARDTLRLEMGYPLYGHELSEARTPAAVSRGAFVDLEKEFIGRKGVAAELADPRELLVGLKFGSRRAARQHDKVFAGNVEIGEVTSGSYAPSVGTAVAMAFVRTEFAEPGRELQVEIRGKPFPAEVVGLPFYKRGTARGSFFYHGVTEAQR